MPRNISAKAIARAKQLRENWATTDPNLATDDLDLQIFTDQITDSDTKDAEILVAEANLKSLRQSRHKARRIVNDSSKRIMSVAKGRFGDDSPQYKLMGGTPISERARPARRVTIVESTPSSTG